MESDLSELEQACFASIKELQEGEIVEGRVIAVTPHEVVVDVGYKAEGIILCDEFTGVEDLESLDEIAVYVENVEDEEGKIILSYRRANEARGWETLLNEHKEGDVVEGLVNKKVKGGYMVNVFGVEGFFPQSLSAFKNTNTEDSLVGKKFFFQILNLSKARNNFILSRRDALKAEREIVRRKLWESMEIGQVRKGIVKSITNFGAFVDMGGMDGLLPIADMRWEKVSHPSEVVAVGEGRERIYAL